MSHHPQVPTTTETLVLGAGYAGLAAAALLAQAGQDVTVVEAHDTVGGCASFFKMGKYAFDVGATTFSGVRPHQPAGRVFARLGLQPELERVDPGMILRLPDGDVIRHADPEAWIDHVAELFPVGDQRGFWKHLYGLETAVYDLIQDKPYLPPSTAGDWIRMADPRNLSAVRLLPGLFRPMSALMQRYGVDADPRFLSLVNEQMLISTQSTAAEAPYLTGAMGLTYPSETYYPVGGMIRPAILLLRSITGHGGQVKFRRRVISLSQTRDGWWEAATSNGERYRARTVISSIPVWNMATVVKGAPQAWYHRYARQYPQAWAALTLYFVLEGVPKLPTPYIQMHVDEDLPFVHSRSLFLTVSRPHDRHKAPEGESTVTVSTHARFADWADRTPEQHREQKQRMVHALRAVIERRVPEFAGMRWHHVEAGTPQTWIHYTGRHNGFVGGIPHTVRQNMLALPRNQTPFKGLYQIGDSAFPGQGTPAVMMGAWNTAERVLASSV